MKHMTEGLWTYLCVCVPDVLVCGMFGCELSLIACGSCESSYNGFGSLTCCSVMKSFVGRRFECTCFPSGSFSYFSFMDVLVLECRLLSHIHVYYSVYVLRMLMLGYWF